MIKKTLFFVFLWMFGWLAKGQIINVEQYRSTIDTNQALFSNAGLGLLLKHQNKDVFNFYWDLHTIYVRPKHAYMLITDLDIERIDHENFLNEGWAHFRANFLRKRKISPELFSQGQYDIGRGLDSRFLIGADARFGVINNDRWSLSIGTGVMVEDEVWDDNYGTVIHNQLVKTADYVNVNGRLNQYVSVFLSNYYQARFNQLLKPRYTSDWSLLFKAGKRSAIKTRLILTYDADPVIDSGKFIYALKMSFVYKIWS